MVYVLSNLSYYIDRWNKELNSLADNFFDNPFSGMAVFIVLLVIGFIAIKAYTK